MDNPISFGAVPSFDDPRTLSSANIAKGVTTPPSSGRVPLNDDYTNDLCNQKLLGICTACGVRMAAESYFKDVERLSEYWLYLIGKTLYDDPVFGHFEGSSALTMLKTANKIGIPTKSVEEKFPLKIDGTYAEFIADFKKKYDGKIPAEIISNAGKHKIPGYFRIFPDSLSGGAPSPSGMASEINSGRVIITRFAVGDSTHQDKNGKETRKAKDLLPLRAPKNIESGHIWDLNEFWKSGKEFGGPNSWGRTWCVGNTKQEDGYFWFEFKTQIPFFTEAWAIMGKADSYIFTVDLTLGSTGPDVVALQKILVSQGFFIMPEGVAYGYFGAMTRDAVARYQRVYGITPAAGYFGPKTRAHLNENQ